MNKRVYLILFLLPLTATPSIEMPTIKWKNLSKGHTRTGLAIGGITGILAGTLPTLIKHHQTKRSIRTLKRLASSSESARKRIAELETRLSELEKQLPYKPKALLKILALTLTGAGLGSAAGWWFDYRAAQNALAHETENRVNPFADAQNPIIPPNIERLQTMAGNLVYTPQSLTDAIAELVNRPTTSVFNIEEELRNPLPNYRKVVESLPEMGEDIKSAAAKKEQVELAGFKAQLEAQEDLPLDDLMFIKNRIENAFSNVESEEVKSLLASLKSRIEEAKRRARIDAIRQEQAEKIRARTLQEQREATEQKALKQAYAQCKIKDITEAIHRGKSAQTTPEKVNTVLGLIQTSRSAASQIQDTQTQSRINEEIDFLSRRLGYHTLMSFYQSLINLRTASNELNTLEEHREKITQLNNLIDLSETCLMGMSSDNIATARTNMINITQGLEHLGHLIEPYADFVRAGATDGLREALIEPRANFRRAYLTKQAVDTPLKKLQMNPLATTATTPLQHLFVESSED